MTCMILSFSKWVAKKKGVSLTAYVKVLNLLIKINPVNSTILIFGMKFLSVIIKKIK